MPSEGEVREVEGNARIEILSFQIFFEVPKQSEKLSALTPDRGHKASERNCDGGV